MKAAHSRTVLIVMLLGGLALGLTGIGFGAPMAVAVFGVVGIAHLVMAGLLARHVFKPGESWAFSPLGQVLQGCAWLLGAGIFLVVGDPGDSGIPWAFVAPAILLFAGFLVENKARASQASV